MCVREVSRRATNFCFLNQFPANPAKTGYKKKKEEKRKKTRINTRNSENNMFLQKNRQKGM